MSPQQQQSCWGYQDLLPVLAYCVLHALLQVCPCQVVLADVQVSHSCVLQFFTELLPRIHANLKVLARIECPDAAFLQHFCQLDKLIIKHALHNGKACEAVLYNKKTVPLILHKHIQSMTGTIPAPFPVIQLTRGK